MKNIKLGDKWIGDDYPCYIVAEIGTAYRNFEEAKKLIDAAVEIGVDAIKLQTFEAETITTKNNFLDLEETGFVSQYELFKKLEIPKEEQLQIVKYANEKNMPRLRYNNIVPNSITSKNGSRIKKVFLE